MRKQKGPSAFGFDRYDTGRLLRAIAKATDTRIYIRLKAVLLIAQGEPISKVAKFFDKSKVFFPPVFCLCQVQACSASHALPTTPPRPQI
jgi:hypothetical protein